jgi:hypothetical protein
MDLRGLLLQVICNRFLLLFALLLSSGYAVHAQEPPYFVTCSDAGMRFCVR